MFLIKWALQSVHIRHLTFDLTSDQERLPKERKNHFREET